MKRFFASAFLLVVAGTSVAWNVSAQTLLVANQLDRTVSVIDAKSGHAGGDDRGRCAWAVGHEIVASADGRKAFLPIYGNSGVGKPGIDGSKLLVIDVGLREVTGVIDFGHAVRPHLPVMDSAHGVLYVTTELDDAVYDCRSGSAGDFGKDSDRSKGVAYAGRFRMMASWGYTANVGPGTVSVLDMVGTEDCGGDSGYEGKSSAFAIFARCTSGCSRRMLRSRRMGCD